MFNLKNRSFLTLTDFTPEEIAFLLEIARELKAARYAGTEQPRLKGKSIALIFEKTSTRTRIGFEVAAYDQGAHVTYLGPTGTQIGHKETMKDTARVLGRIYHAIEYRGFSQENVETLAAYSGVPVYNGLTDEYHPTQVLADLLTIREHSPKQYRDVSLCFVGDASNNMGATLMVGAAQMGMDIRLCGPESLKPDPVAHYLAASVADGTGARITISSDIEECVHGADFIYTDVWLSMGEPEDRWAERIKLLQPYRVDARMLDLTGNRAVKFMHCLPAFHNSETEVGARIKETFGIEAMEVTDEVFESRHSIVFDQAENRLHTIKAVLVATIGG